MRSSDRKILLGKLGKPHGVKGFLYIHYYGEDPNKLYDYEGLLLDDGTLVKVDKLLLQKDRVILKFLETNSRNDAEKLRDKELFIKEDSLPVLKNNQAYYFELEGLNVKNLDNVDLGRVKEILETNANDVLVIEPTKSSVDEKERLVPYLKDNVVKEINKIDKTILIDWSEDY
tara:strand:- start:171 stop:689 length:519 start_codon:yes stop_codon:yes gene_type:complete